MTSTLSAPNRASPATAMLCPFHDGAATLDLLLADLDSRDSELFDAVLDLRSLAMGDEPLRCLEQLFRVRQLLGERHYLAFYRVRCWAHRTFRVQVRAARNVPWMVRDLPLDCARLDELVNSSLASVVSDDGTIPESAHVRFTFANAAT